MMEPLEAALTGSLKAALRCGPRAAVFNAGENQMRAEGRYGQSRHARMSRRWKPSRRPPFDCARGRAMAPYSLAVDA